jgi:hypothetical protein
MRIKICFTCLYYKQQILKVTLENTINHGVVSLETILHCPDGHISLKGNKKFPTMNKILSSFLLLVAMTLTLIRK